MAAGLTVDARAFKAFRSALQAHGDARLGPDDLRPRVRVDARLDLDAIRGRLVEEIKALEPFGIGNPFWSISPRFAPLPPASARFFLLSSLNHITFFMPNPSKLDFS